MKQGQLSFELLILIAALLAFLAAFIPIIGNAKHAIDYGIAAEGARLIAGKLEKACAYAHITGSAQEVELHAPAEYNITSTDNEIAISFLGINGTASIVGNSSYECGIIQPSLHIGKNTMIISPE